MLKKIIFTLALVVSTYSFSQKTLSSEEKVVCTWSEYEGNFTNCITSRASIKFVFNREYTIMFTVGDVNATFYLDEGTIDGDNITFNATADGENCMVFLNNQTNTVKFLFKNSGKTMLVTYLL